MIHGLLQHGRRKQTNVDDMVPMGIRIGDVLSIVATTTPQSRHDYQSRRKSLLSQCVRTLFSKQKLYRSSSMQFQDYVHQSGSFGNDLWPSDYTGARMDAIYPPSLKISCISVQRLLCILVLSLWGLLTSTSVDMISQSVTFSIPGIWIPILNFQRRFVTELRASTVGLLVYFGFEMPS